MVKNRGGENDMILPGGENGISPSNNDVIIRDDVTEIADTATDSKKPYNQACITSLR